MTKGQASAVAACVDMRGNAFVTGEAGCGKTFVLRTVVDILQQMGFVLCRDVYVVTAVGAAAAQTQVSGATTIHSFAGFGITLPTFDAYMRKVYTDSALMHRIQAVKCIIIDEISMVHKDLFCFLSQVMCTIRRVSAPFGGCTILAFGDFMQLPPVDRQSQQECSWYQSESAFAFKTDLWRRTFPPDRCYYLSGNQRQKDREFMQMLVRIRNGDRLDLVKEYLMSRNVQEPKGAVHITARREDADDINMTNFLSLSGPVHSIAASDVGPAAGVLDRYVQASRVVRLKVGAKVMLIKNYMREGLVNGSIGVVLHINPVDHRKPIQSVSVQFEHCVKTLYPDAFDVPEICSRRTQIPLLLAWAITIHKAQGMTLPAAVVDIGRTFGPAQSYVAISRTSTPDKLVVRGLHTAEMSVDTSAAKFCDTLKKDVAGRHASADSYCGLHHACERGDLAVVCAMLSIPRLDLTLRNELQSDPLQTALTHGRINIALELLRHPSVALAAICYTAEALLLHAPQIELMHETALSIAAFRDTMKEEAYRTCDGTADPAPDATDVKGRTVRLTLSTFEVLRTILSYMVDDATGTALVVEEARHPIRTLLMDVVRVTTFGC